VRRSIDATATSGRLSLTPVIDATIFRLRRRCESRRDVIFAGSVSDEAARELWPGGWQAPKPYIRIVPQPA
jgi:hypothetical protein